MLINMYCTISNIAILFNLRCDRLLEALGKLDDNVHFQLKYLKIFFVKFSIFLHVNFFITLQTKNTF